MADLERKSQGYVNSQIAKSIKGSQVDRKNGSPSNVSGMRRQESSLMTGAEIKKKNITRGESHGGGISQSMINQNEVRVKIRRSQTKQLSKTEVQNEDTIGNIINNVVLEEGSPEREGAPNNIIIQTGNNSSQENITSNRNTSTEQVTHRKIPNMITTILSDDDFNRIETALKGTIKQQVNEAIVEYFRVTRNQVSESP